jgi:hypothetical protein
MKANKTPPGKDKFLLLPRCKKTPLGGAFRGMEPKAVSLLL